ncbi:MAG: DUF177 domain-containing protein [Alistipes sp.]|nr:DUF177 domain-containing protein [Alistipes sp.]
MDTVRKYSIAYKGLSLGEHTFDFEIGEDLFQLFENQEIRGGNCRAEVRLVRSERQLRLEVSIRGEVVVECDRCLGDCALPVDYTGTLVVKFSDEIREYDGETMWLSAAQDHIELAQYLYESIVLSLPYQRVHPEGGCDPDMLRRFRIVSDEEFERIENRAQQQSAPAAEDDRWSRSLETLKERMEQEEKEEEKKR